MGHMLAMMATALAGSAMHCAVVLSTPVPMAEERHAFASDAKQFLVSTLRIGRCWCFQTLEPISYGTVSDMPCSIRVGCFWLLPC